MDANKALVKAQELSKFYPILRVCDFYCNDETLREHLKNNPGVCHLIILAVDRDRVRNQIINYFDRLKDVNYVFVLPGNGLTSFNTLWYGKVLNEVCPIHPFQVADNWANPKDTVPGSCLDIVDTSPQVITANMGAAWSSLQMVYSLLEDAPMPFCVDFTAKRFSMLAEGKPKYFSNKTLKALAKLQGLGSTTDVAPATTAEAVATPIQEPVKPTPTPTPIKEDATVGSTTVTVTNTTGSETAAVDKASSETLTL
jgi:hypothetical protein